MSTAMQTTSGPDASAIEQTLIGGDLSKLSPAQRVSYYRAVCDSIGVNYLTKPFAFIVLNNKLTLYALKDCADQLRSNRKVSIAIVSKDRVEDVYVVTARATTPDGRADESTGAVNLQGLRGEALANALMKAETKAKRRVTLSICGLGMTDESEIESIPGAQRVQIDVNTGEIADAIAVDASPDFDALLEKAATLDELKAIGKDINDAGKAGRIAPELRKALGEKYKARASALGNGVAA